MARALLDTSVLFAAAYRRDDRHADALPIVRGIDDGSLPEAVVLDYVLAETLNGLGTHAGHDPAADLLDRVEENRRFHVESPSAATRATGKALFRRHRALSFVDACLVAYGRTNDLAYLYAFDDDFDATDLDRLDAPANPYDPG
jgi:predicted nucleic acid-binding protein